MGIGGIGGLGGFNYYSSYQLNKVQPMSYSLDNEADVSDAYKESMGVNRSKPMEPVPPVRYPNAQAGRVDEPDSRSDARAADRQFNNIAARYSGNTIGYERNLQGQSYSMVGSMFDASV